MANFTFRAHILPITIEGAAFSIDVNGALSKLDGMVAQARAPGIVI